MTTFARVLVLSTFGAGAALASSENLSPTLAPIVEAERAFARRCGEVGVRQSFLEFFAPDSVSFEPDPGPAIARLESRPPPKGPPPGVLEWGPEMAEVSADGLMGWTTGPARFIDKTGKSPGFSGYYFSVWQKQPDGKFKVVIDIGTDSPRDPKTTEIPTVATAVGPQNKAAPKGPTPSTEVQRRDEEFCKAAEGGAQKAYAAALAPNARMHLEGTLPAVGEKAWRDRVAKLSGVMTCKPQGGGTATGLGYTYGSWERREKTGGEVAEKGFYTRVWRQDGAGWQIAADVRALVKK